MNLVGLEIQLYPSPTQNVCVRERVQSTKICKHPLKFNLERHMKPPLA